jgi:hypothetical protein
MRTVYKILVGNLKGDLDIDGRTVLDISAEQSPWEAEDMG